MTDRRARSPLRPIRSGAGRPTYSDADPALIAAATERAMARPAGNWYVVAGSAELRPGRTLSRRVGGAEIVLWRDPDGAVAAGPGACPHLGAPLAEGRVDRAGLTCRWHGLTVTPGGGPGWSPLPCHDDGVLIHLRLDRVGGEVPLAGPPRTPRPESARRVSSVLRVSGVCEPVDVVANRLDPWHGAWFHPHSFARLHVVEAPGPGTPDPDDRFLVEVTFRVAPGLGVPVLAEFRCPHRRAVVMRILDGEGAGSVVETHATPQGPGADGRPQTAVTEVVASTSERPGFARAARAAPLLRPWMRRAAARLWRDDIAYAQRRYALRRGEVGNPRPHA